MYGVLMRNRAKDESGAYAVLFALLVITLASMGALAVDLGNAVARKSDVQGQADIAALAGGAELPATVAGNATLTATNPIVIKVRDYLNENRPRNWDASCSAEQPCVTSAELVDGNLLNGDVRYANGGLRVRTPYSRVDYGLAKVMGFNQIDVIGEATVNVYSPKVSILPAYSVSPCDYGRQTLTDGPVMTPAPIPALALDGETNSTVLAAVNPTSSALNPPSQPTISLSVINGNNNKFQDTTKIGFFRSDNLLPAAIVEVNSFTPAPGATGYTGTGSVTLTVPSAVTSQEVVWYIRVYDAGTQNKWSARSQALAFRVGNAVLECNSDALGGNFGTLRVDRSDTPSGEELARNISEGLQEGIGLTTHLQAVSPWECTHGQNGAVESDLPNPGFNLDTNCLQTDPGLPANAAASGLVEGGASFDGRLHNKPTRPNCSPSGGSGMATVQLHSTYLINDDVLSCYLTNGTTSLADIASGSYSGGEVLDPAIIDSPRFFFIPIIKVQPETGLKRYSIIDFRPAFLTDEVVAPSSVRGTHTATPTHPNDGGNGLKIEHNDITQMKVIFFNLSAIKFPEGGDVMTYLGVGEKRLRLID